MELFPKNFKPYEITLTEHFNEKSMYKHIYSGNCDLQYSHELLDYLKKSKNGQIKIIYKVDEIGRLKAYYNNKYIKSQMSQERNTKHAILSEYYDDVDMVNSQPNVLEQLMNKYNLPTNHINIYNQNREDIILGFRKQHMLTRDEVKDIVYTFMNNSKDNIHNLINKYGIKKHNKRLYNHIKQIMDNRTELIKYYPNLLKYVKNKKKLKKWKNIEGTTFSYIGQQCERICLLSMLEFFNNKGYEVGALIHDGLHLRRNKMNRKLIIKCEEYVYEKTGFEIKLKIKSFEKKETLNKIRFDNLKGIKKLNITTHHIKSKFLTKLNKNDKHGLDLASLLEPNKISLIISSTGSGKTKMIKQLQKLYPDYDVISIVSRRTLSDMHEIEFSIANYQKTNKHSYNEVYQLDSLNKVPKQTNKPYILIMDEQASLCCHFLNSMKKMSKYRLKFIAILANLINNDYCKFVIGMDANMNYGAIKFIKDITITKSINLYINTYRNKLETPLYIYNDKNMMLSNLIDNVNNGQTAFICSNMNDDFKREIVNLVINECNLNDDEYLLYSSNEGEKYINTVEWKHKRVIFCTPSVLYGCDSNYKFHVYGFYFKSYHMVATDIDQQINRERQPKSINLYIPDMYIKPFNTLEQAEKDGKLDININTSLKSVSKYINPLRDILVYEDYRKSYHLNLKHHVIDLLKKKGYVNINFELRKSKKYNIITKTEYIKTLIEKYHSSDFKNDIFTRENNNFLKDLRDNKNILETDKFMCDLMTKLELFSLEYTMNDETDKYYNDIINNHLDIFLDRKKFKQLLNYIIYKNENYNKLIIDKKTKTQFKNEPQKYRFENENYDIIEMIVKKDSTKLYLLNIIRNLLKIKKFDSTILKTVNKNNYNDIIVMKDIDVKLFNKSFRIRGAKLENKTSRLELTKLYMSKMNIVIGCIVDCKKKNKRIGDKKHGINTFNQKYISAFEKIINFKDQISKLYILDD